VAKQQASAPGAANILDTMFAATMASGMRDYEQRSDVVRRKTALFSHVPVGARVLEIGIGAGPNLPYYGSRAGAIVAVEPNGAMDEYTVETAARAGVVRSKLTLVRGKAEALPLPDASLDVVVGTLVLCSVDDVAASLREVRRVLKPGGKYLFMEHVAAPAEFAVLGAAQTVFDPLQQVAGGGCHLRRSPLEAIGREFDLGGAREDYAFVLDGVNKSPPWPPHFLLAPHIAGVAVKSRDET